MAFSQIGGRHAFEFLASPVSSRVTALGGSLIGVVDNDVNLAMSNPALLNNKMNQQIALNYNSHFADIGLGHFAYGQYLKKFDINMQVAASFVNYGDFQWTDQYANVLGTFDAFESAITLGASKKINQRITLGSNIKVITGKYELEKSSGLAFDFGMIYRPDNPNTILSAVIKNYGTSFRKIGEIRYKTPLDIQIGISQRLAHLPLRFSIIANHLQQWSIRYDDPSTKIVSNIFNDDEQSKFSKNVDNVFRHLIFNAELLLGKKENLNLRFGYNHLRRKELSLSEFRSLAGFSLGIGLKVKQFKLDYGVGYYHLEGGVNHFSISTNLSSFKKSKLDEI